MPSIRKLPATPIIRTISLVFLVSIHACTAGQVPTTTVTAGSKQTNYPQITSTYTPKATITRIPSKTPTVTPTPVPTGVFALKFYPPLILNYDPILWDDKSEYTNLEMMINYLQSRELDTCQIGVAGPSGNFPPQYEVITYGNVRYLVSKTEDIVNKLTYGLFIEDQSLVEYDYTDGLPVLNVIANPEEWLACMDRAEKVLASLNSPSN